VRDKPVTGIPDPGKPGYWLVPPWPVQAGFSEVAQHFLRFSLRNGGDSVHWLAYFEGYAAALDTAPTRELTHPVDWKWRDDLRDCVARCVAAHQDKRKQRLGTGPTEATRARIVGRH
jgi:hypothetical protein